MALFDLGMTLPIVAAPMAGGPTTPGLVVAAAQAGGIGLLAGGYQTAAAFATQVAVVRAAGVAFGVNLFAPNPVPADPIQLRDYAALLQGEADRYDLVLDDRPIEDDDAWQAKVEHLLTDPVPLVSFTFGIPDPGVVAALRKSGTVVVQTVTSAVEARQAAAAGVDALAVQACAAGGHSGTLTPEQLPPAVPLGELLAAVRHAVTLPLVAAGGLATPREVATALRSGADAVMVGTALLLADESGTSATYRQALSSSGGADTLVTRAFSGRPARGLRNAFTDRYHAVAPAGYPAVHHLTTPLRRAATAAGDSDRINLWAGTGHQHATPGPAAEILAHLGSAL